MPDQVLPAPPQLSLLALFTKFLRFGFLAFGGPVAQIAMVRQALIEEECWISRERFNRLLAVMQVLPGPEAHELCVHLGMVARGRIGGLLAGLGFMLPGLLLMMICGWIYTTVVAGVSGVEGVLLGVQVAVLAIIARAIHRIGGHILADRFLWALAGIGLIATLAGVPFWVPLVAAALAYASPNRLWASVALAGVAVLAAWALLPDDVTAPFVTQAQGVPQAALPALFVAGLKGGLLTFGGAYTAIPYVRTDTVGRGWLSDGQFLDGVAFANILPAPLVIFATFAGYIAAGSLGALAITAGMFLPAFAFSMLFFERLEAVVENPRLHRLLDGVAAAVVGIISATLLQLGFAAWGRIDEPLPAAAIFVVAAILAWRLKGALVAPGILGAAGLFGWILFN
ncbi:chromate efflux transporter [Alteraurantiacibacter buctensis]|uniref:Chromate efflux transporter n=1 Tax=Alteraurantiacibacter buctensis TaxID=1503981 RepID=A0A844YX04_9SPHN|nr:chromate efflux transporter [Alteraurantiacibacter buctensis]MXO70263.1 chromate efflux transporter [Alteraurantiacibacter buctensis]